MKCPLQFDQIGELVVAYGARTLDPAATAAFERHMNSCAACTEAAAVQRAVWSALDEWRELPVSPDFNRRLYARIAEAENRAWWRWRMSLRWLPPMAACIALAAVVLLRQPVSAPPPQIEQVQNALEDMDLLNQIGPAI